MPLGAARLNTLSKVLDTAVDYGERTSDSIPLTVQGNAQISTAQSKFGVSSVLFDGTGDGLNTDRALLPATDDWTVEAWVRPTTINATDYWFSQYAAGVSGRTTFYYTSTGAVGLFINTGPSFTTSAGAVTANTWTHIAWVRNGSDYRIYINGVDTANATAGGTITQSYNFVVGAQDTAGSNGTIGYMDEIRVSDVARYTSGFTPSTTAFTPDGATLLLIHGDGTNGSTDITDDPAAASLRTTGFYNVIAHGNAQLSNTQYKFRTGTRGGSIYMDGTGDYLSINDNINFGTGDFTIEWFQYLTSLDRFAIDMRDGSNGAKILLYSYPSDGSADDLYLYVSSANRITALNCISANTWQHIALVRESGSTRLYVDGSQVGSTYSDSNNYAHAELLIWENTLSVGNYSPPGYVDEFRISNVARYSGASLTVPTAAFEPDGKTMLLLHGDGPYGQNGNFHIVDDIGDLRPLDIHIQTNSTGVGAPTISTAQSKFGGSSLRINDNDGHAEFAHPEFGSQFTIEFWFRPDGVSGTQWMSGVWGGAGSGGFSWGIYLSGSTVRAYVWNGSYQLNNANVGTASANTWHHVAVTWDGSTYRTFLNGTAGGTASSSTPPNFEKWMTAWVGTVQGTTDNFGGYIDEFRLSDTARYTSSFTAPTSAFTNDANTQVLLHFNGTNGATTTTDDAS